MSNLKSAKYLLRFIKYGPAAFVLLVGVLFKYSIHTEQQRTLTKDVAHTTETYIALSKTMIKDQVQHLLNRLNHEHELLQKRLQQVTENDVNYGIQLANEVIAQNKGQPRHVIENAVIEALRYARLQFKNGYFIILDTKGIGVLNNNFANFRGLNVLNIADGKGRHIMQDITDHLRTHDNMQLNWHWKKPGTTDKQKLKIGYFAKIEGLDWIIGTGSYVEDYTAQVQDRLLREIETIRYGTNGYISVIAHDGTFLAHRITERVGKTLFEVNDVEDAREKWDQALIMVANGGGFIEAVHNWKPGSTIPTQKLYYLEEFPQWKWVLSTGFYNDDLKNMLLPRIKDINERHEAYIRNLWIYGSLLTAMVLLASIGLSKHLETTFRSYSDKLEQLSITDKLTGLHNRLKLDAVLDYEHNKFERYAEDLSVILLDIDRFKQINDTYGHQAGDQTLIKLANILHADKRETDVVGRWGGEEFLIICPHTDKHAALTVAERYRQLIAQSTFSDVGSVTASFGISSFAAGDTQDTVMKRADDALYQAKANGRNQSIVL